MHTFQNLKLGCSLIQSWLLAHERLTAFGLGILIGLPFVFPVVTLVAYGGLIVLALMVAQTDATRLLVTLPLVFFAKALVVLSVIFATFPLDWLGDFSWFVQFLALSFYWVSSALVLGSAGLLLAVFVYVYRRYLRWLPTVLIPVTVAVGVVVAEYLSAYFFSFIMMGVGGYLSADFSFGHSGYLFPWLYPLAKGAGVYTVGIGGLLIILAIAVAVSTRRWRYLTPIIFVCGFFILGYTHLTYEGRSITVALIETHDARTDNNPPDNEYGATLEKMVIFALRSNPDYIIFPEDSRYLVSYYAGNTVGIKEAIAAWSILHPEATSTVFIDSNRTITSAGPVQRATIWQGDTLLAQTDKQYLVPQGEYMPWVYQQVFSLMGLQSLVTSLSDERAYVSGVTMSPETPAIVPSILFCFESVAPAFARTMSQERPQSFIVHPISHAWFRSPVVVQRQLETMLRFQAVWSDVPIVSVGNMAEGKVYTPTGEVIIPHTVDTVGSNSVRIVTVLRPD